ncbi:hypothetical protein N657DRAFT_449601 [Parathielavia appendiculata]|uniref:Uncharacterized protein n=1 Tax=Parathielavia appendiculata TaxID=2587402 RepID=A0AAN6U0P9_9PEZI|nr:hypothetical protein N657DRAFT_449601 [Parathielavia appendiculata]
MGNQIVPTAMDMKHSDLARDCNPDVWEQRPNQVDKPSGLTAGPSLLGRQPIPSDPGAQEPNLPITNACPLLRNMMCLMDSGPFRRSKEVSAGVAPSTCSSRNSRDVYTLHQTETVNTPLFTYSTLCSHIIRVPTPLFFPQHSTSTTVIQPSASPPYSRHHIQ